MARRRAWCRKTWRHTRRSRSGGARRPWAECSTRGAKADKKGRTGQVMRRTFGLLTAVIALLLGLQGTATAGVAWFQTRDDHSGHRAGAGVLTVPRLGGAQIGEVVMWTEKRVLVSSAGVVRELTFQGESIEDTSGVVVIALPLGEDGGGAIAGLVIWTPQRVLLAVETDVIELTFQDESITKTLGVLAFVFDSSGLAGGLVIWTQKRVLIASASAPPLESQWPSHRSEDEGGQFCLRKWVNNCVR